MSLEYKVPDYLPNEIKNILLDELRAKGYAPNPRDVQEATVRFLTILENEVNSAIMAAEKLAASATVTPPIPSPLIGAAGIGAAGTGIPEVPSPTVTQVLTPGIPPNPVVTIPKP